jgi:SulP family sulfate permease
VFSLVAKFVPDLKNYNKSKFSKDLIAGLIVGIVALPLSMALAISVGVSPVVGLYTAGTAGLVAAIFSGSPFNVSGPAAAMIPVLAAIYKSVDYDFAKLQYIGLLAGVLLLVFGLLRVGKLIEHVPHAVTVGFTAGVAVAIFFGQLPAFLGLSNLGNHEHFLDKTLDMFSHLGTLGWPTVVIGLLSTVIILYAGKVRFIRKVPSTLTAIVAATLFVKYIPWFDSVKTIAEKFGTIPNGLPLPAVSLITDNIGSTPHFLIPAFKIAVLVSIESLLCAVVADKLTKTRHNSNQELAAQGMGNLVAPLFGGFASTAVIARTGTIVKSGAKSRLATIIHALIILVFVIFLSSLAGMLPLPALSAILLITAWRISERKEVIEMLDFGPWITRITLLLTFGLTVFVDLTAGVGVGILFYYFAKGVTHESRVLVGEAFDEDIVADDDELEEAGVDEYRTHGRKAYKRNPAHKK